MAKTHTAAAEAAEAAQRALSLALERVLATREADRRTAAAAADTHKAHVHTWLGTPGVHARQTQDIRAPVRAETDMQNQMQQRVRAGVYMVPPPQQADAFSCVLKPLSCGLPHRRLRQTSLPQPVAQLLHIALEWRWVQPC